MCRSEQVKTALSQGELTRIVRPVFRVFRVHFFYDVVPQGPLLEGIIIVVAGRVPQSWKLLYKCHKIEHLIVIPCGHRGSNRCPRGLTCGTLATLSS